MRGIVECEAGPTAQLGLDMDPGGVRTGLMQSAKLSTHCVFPPEAQDSHICPVCLSEQNPFLKNT